VISLLTERLRDTLVHELCHAMVWIEHKVLDGHGNYWKYWYSSCHVIAFAVLFNHPTVLELLHFPRCLSLTF